MARLVRSPLAKRDIVEVIAFTKRRWGLAFHIRQPGRDARHVLLYVVGEDGTARVLRLLHDAMDFERQLR